MEIVEIHLNTIDSTNTYAKHHFHEFVKDKITCILANEQTAGRGRFDRTWHSPPNVNLYATFVFRLPPITTLGTITQVLSVSLATVLSQMGLSPQLKWPNDVLLNKKKVSGILCEAKTLSDGFAVFLGIGVNVNLTSDQLKSIPKPATSLLNETSRTHSIFSLFQELAKQFSMDLDLFIQYGFQPFHQQYETLMIYRGETIRCFDGKTEWTGVCHSITDDGRLNLLLPDQSIHTLSAGDIL